MHRSDGHDAKSEGASEITPTLDAEIAGLAVALDATNPTAGRWRRRAMLAGGALAVTAWVVGIPRLGGLWSSRLAFQAILGLAPFRALETTGTLSTASGLLIGLDAGQPPDAVGDVMIAEVRANPCAALFGTQKDPRLPIAFFSDFNCPNCRILYAILTEYDAKHPDTIRIIHHELPLLGAASTIASKAVLAADLQGGYTAMHDRLIRAQMVTDLNYVVTMAQSVGLDGRRLVADMQSPEIETALDKSKAIAKVFGFYGTPATVIGSTFFLGAIPAVDVAQIIEAELAAPARACSAG
jgi:protein-disulfide isomerase